MAQLLVYDREDQRTTVHLRGGRSLEVWNADAPYWDGDGPVQVVTNLNPAATGSTRDVFLSSDVVLVLDEEGRELYRSK